jgi:hypothetical protein
MSEFVECQNCGRTFFAENLDCPYCSKQQEAEDREEREGRTGRARAGRSAAGGGVHGAIFGIFMLLLAGSAVLALLTLFASRPGMPRVVLGLEAAGAVATLAGLAARRRWGRALAVVFILGNGALGLAAAIARGQGDALAWGPGPAAFLLFLLPFLGPAARDRFSR